MITISGGTFNFTGSYAAPTWSGSTYDFYNISIYQIYSTTNNIYAVSNLGLSIFDPTTDKLHAYIDYSTGFTTIGGNTQHIYLGTTTSGIKYISTTNISGSVNNPYNLQQYLTTLHTTNITSNNIKYLHVLDNKITVCTDSGIDYYRFNTNPEIHSQTFTSSADKCFTTEKSIYYTVSGTNTTSGIKYELNRIDTCLTDWAIPTYTYTTGSGVFLEGLKLTDLYITEGTAGQGGNTIFCTTSSGVYVIDEDTQKYAIYYTE